MFTSVVVALVITGSHVSAQDPAEGWMAYAVGSLPTKAERITRLEMTWTVGANAKKGGSFYSPWFGMDPSDNLNLLQPVNPWTGRGWQMYTESYQWSPQRNSNSRSFSVKAGQTLHGAIIYSTADDSYTIQQTIVETGEKSSQVVKCQNGKKFTVPYVVYEKTWGCSSYPPDGKVTFHDIVVECDGTDCTKDVQWQAKVMDDNCNMRAHIDPSANAISITWDTAATSKYDNYTAPQLFALNARGWGARFAQKASVQEPTFVEEFHLAKESVAVRAPEAQTMPVPFIVGHNESAAQQAKWQNIHDALNGATDIKATCNKDMRAKMPACHQFGSMWCWATGIAELTEYYTSQGPPQCKGLECEVVTWCPKPPSCASHRGATCCPLAQHESCGNDGASLGMVVEAATHFTGRTMKLSHGPMSQETLDKTLQSGNPILMLVGDKTPYHVVAVAGCGDGSYHFHDPEWQAGKYESYTYDNLLKSSYYGYKWLDTISAAGTEATVVV